ncbi:MAG: FHA domain-containing protein [Deltaproteobacteria bacterium]|nr:FHA domain-containing protein [Deltaproteobacteria bacterium]
MQTPLDPTVPVATKSGALKLMVVRDQRVEWQALQAPCRVVVGRAPQCDLTVDDPSLSRRHAVLELDDQGARVTDLGSSNGTSLAGTRLPPNEPRPVALDELIEIGATVMVLRRVQQDEAAARSPYARVRALARQAAAERMHVCLLGEAGTGKRTIAELIHRESGVATPLRALAAAQLDVTQIQSLVTDEPTVLLHLTETPRALHAALADAIEARRARLLLTTRVEPSSLLRGRHIEPALVSACDALTLVVPPLRVCGEELTTLAAEVATTVGRAASPPRELRLTERANAWLMARAWLDNLRELRQTIERAARLTDGPTLDQPHLDNDYRELSHEDRERQRILDALTTCAGNQTAAARMLKMSRRSLVYRLDKYGIARPRKDG